MVASPKKKKRYSQLDLCGGEGKRPALHQRGSLHISKAPHSRRETCFICGWCVSFLLLSFLSTPDGVPDISEQTGAASRSSWYQYQAAPRNTALLGNNDKVCSDTLCVCVCVCVLCVYDCLCDTFHSGSPMTLSLQQKTLVKSISPLSHTATHSTTHTHTHT